MAGFTGMTDQAPPRPAVDHAVTTQDVEAGGAAGQCPLRMTSAQHREQLLSTPGRMSAPELDDRADHVRCGLIR